MLTDGQAIIGHQPSASAVPRPPGRPVSTGEVGLYARGYLKFDEVYPDNGDVNMYQAVLAYKEVGYDGMLCPDHVPQSDADPDNERQHSFCLGYTKALLQVAGY